MIWRRLWHDRLLPPVVGTTAHQVRGVSRRQLWTLPTPGTMTIHPHLQVRGVHKRWLCRPPPTQFYSSDEPEETVVENVHTPPHRGKTDPYKLRSHEGPGNDYSDDHLRSKKETTKGPRRENRSVPGRQSDEERTGKPLSPVRKESWRNQTWTTPKKPRKKRSWVKPYPFYLSFGSLQSWYGKTDSVSTLGKTEEETWQLSEEYK